MQDVSILNQAVYGGELGKEVDDCVADTQLAKALGVCRENEVRFIPRTRVANLMNILAGRA
jgi:hypothetical protein